MADDVCEHQNAQYLAMMSERDALRAEVERLREGVFAAVTVLNREFYRRPATWVGRLAADLRTLLAGSGEQPGETVGTLRVSDWPDGRTAEVRFRPAPVVPDNADVRNLVRRALAGAVVDSEPVNAYASRPITFGEGASGALLDDLTDAVLAAVRPSGQEGS